MAEATDWSWSADVSAYPLDELFVNALSIDFKRSGFDVRVDLSTFNHYYAIVFYHAWQEFTPRRE